MLDIYYNFMNILVTFGVGIVMCSIIIGVAKLKANKRSKKEWESIGVMTPNDPKKTTVNSVR